VTDAEAIATGERAIAAAHLALDLGVIDRLYHPDFVIAQPDGTTETKEQVLASYRSGDRRWDFAEVDQLDIRVTGDTGIVVGRWRARGANGDQGFDYAARFLSVWVRIAAGWRNLAYQSVKIPFDD
jgi:ketosteroid isomerase-like protein